MDADRHRDWRQSDREFYSLRRKAKDLDLVAVKPKKNVVRTKYVGILVRTSTVIKFKIYQFSFIKSYFSYFIYFTYTSDDDEDRQ